MKKLVSSSQKNARIAGVLFLLSMVLGIYNNLFLLSSKFFAENFLTNVGSNSKAVIQSILISIILGIFSVVISILVYESFKHYSKILAMSFFALNIAKFSFSIVDKAVVFSILSVSQEFLSANGADENFYRLLGNVFINARDLTHLLELFFGFITSILFFYILFRTRLIPLTITAFGLIASFIGATEMLLNLNGYNHKWHLLMLLPMALTQLILAVWLIVKGFNRSEDFREI